MPRFCFAGDLGFLDGSDSKESARNVGDLGLIPGLGRSPRRRHATCSSILAWRIPMALRSHDLYWFFTSSMSQCLHIGRGVWEEGRGQVGSVAPRCEKGVQSTLTNDLKCHSYNPWHVTCPRNTHCTLSPLQRRDRKQEAETHWVSHSRPTRLMTTLLCSTALRIESLSLPFQSCNTNIF